MPGKLNNKVAVITGGNSGIGFAAARLFAKEGAKVAITGRNKQTLDAAVAAVGNGTLGIVSDITDLKNIDNQYVKVHETFGKIDILIANAGVFFGTPLKDFTEELFDLNNAINFKGTFFTVQRALPYLNDGASIVLSSTCMNESGVGMAAAYIATKAANRSLARSFSQELMGRNIRVNVISPGPADTATLRRNGETPEQEKAMKEYFASQNPSKRLVSPEEVAHALLYMASDDSRYMVASEVVLDGGQKGL